MLLLFHGYKEGDTDSVDTVKQGRGAESVPQVSLFFYIYFIFCLVFLCWLFSFPKEIFYQKSVYDCRKSNLHALSKSKTNDPPRPGTIVCMYHLWLKEK